MVVKEKNKSSELESPLRSHRATRGVKREKLGMNNRGSPPNLSEQRLYRAKSKINEREIRAKMLESRQPSYGAIRPEVKKEEQGMNKTRSHLNLSEQRFYRTKTKNGNEIRSRTLLSGQPCFEAIKPEMMKKQIGMHNSRFTLLSLSKSKDQGTSSRRHESQLPSHEAVRRESMKQRQGLKNTRYCLSSLSFSEQKSKRNERESGVRTHPSSDSSSCSSSTSTDNSEMWENTNIDSPLPSRGAVRRGTMKETQGVKHGGYSLCLSEHQHELSTHISSDLSSKSSITHNSKMRENTTVESPSPSSRAIKRETMEETQGTKDTGHSLDLSEQKLNRDETESKSYGLMSSKTMISLDASSSPVTTNNPEMWEKMNIEQDEQKQEARDDTSKYQLDPSTSASLTPYAKNHRTAVDTSNDMLLDTKKQIDLLSALAKKQYEEKRYNDALISYSQILKLMEPTEETSAEMKVEEDKPSRRVLFAKSSENMVYETPVYDHGPQHEPHISEDGSVISSACDSHSFSDDDSEMWSTVESVVTRSTTDGSNLCYKELRSALLTLASSRRGMNSNRTYSTTDSHSVESTSLYDYVVSYFSSNPKIHEAINWCSECPFSGTVHSFTSRFPCPHRQPGHQGSVRIPGNIQTDDHTAQSSITMMTHIREAYMEENSTELFHENVSRT